VVGDRQRECEEGAPPLSTLTEDNEFEEVWGSHDDNDNDCADNMNYNAFY
jgi:hypothetical protein